MNEPTFWIVLTAGFVGSFHCIGMCGPFVGYISIHRQDRTWPRYAAYHLGRLSSYLALGALVGLLGQGVVYLSETLALQRMLMIFLGITMIGLGIWHLLPVTFRMSKFHRFIAKQMGHLRKQGSSIAGAGLLGACASLLPCGYLYSFAFVAGSRGQALESLMVMFAFWLGTVPALLGAGMASRWISKPALSAMQKMMPAFLILFGILAITGKWLVFGVASDPSGATCLPGH
jgi:sulfite exporter TauE/SafE